MALLYAAPVSHVPPPGREKRTIDILRVGILQTRSSIAMASNPEVEPIVLLTVMAGLDVLLQVVAVLC